MPTCLHSACLLTADAPQNVWFCRNPQNAYPENARKTETWKIILLFQAWTKSDKIPKSNRLFSSVYFFVWTDPDEFSSLLSQILRHLNFTET